MEYVVAIEGWEGVGKSAIHLRQNDGFFNETNEIVYPDDVPKNSTIDGKRCIISIVDLHQTTIDTVYNHYHGFMLTFDITSKVSFDKISSFKERILRNRVHILPPSFIIVGNKCDLENEREVSEEECIEIANLLDCAYFEISAKTGLNVTNAFHELCRQIEKECQKLPIRKNTNENDCIIL